MNHSKPIAAGRSRSAHPGAVLSVSVTVMLFARAALAWPGEPERTVLQGDAAESLSWSFSPDGTRVASVDDNQARVWDADTGDEVFRIEEPGAGAAAFSPDGKRLVVTSGRNWAIYSAEDARQLLKLTDVGPRVSDFPFPATIVAVAFRPDGRRLATAGSVARVGGRHGYPGGRARIQDPETGVLVHGFTGLSTVATTVAFSPDGQLLAVGTAGAGGELPEPGRVTIWETVGGVRPLTLEGKRTVIPGENHCAVTCAVFSPDGDRLAWADSEGVVRISDVADGTTVYELSGHEGWVRAVAFSPRGDRLATGGDDGVVCLWDLARGQRVSPLEGHTLPIRAVTFRDDGRRIESVSGTTSRFAPGVAGLIDPDAPEPRAGAGAGEVLHWNTPDER